MDTHISNGSWYVNSRILLYWKWKPYLLVLSIHMLVSDESVYVVHIDSVFTCWDMYTFTVSHIAVAYIFFPCIWVHRHTVPLYMMTSVSCFLFTCIRARSRLLAQPKLFIIWKFIHDVELVVMCRSHWSIVWWHVRGQNYGREMLLQTQKFVVGVCIVTVGKVQISLSDLTRHRLLFD